VIGTPHFHFHYYYKESKEHDRKLKGMDGNKTTEKKWKKMKGNDKWKDLKEHYRK